MKKSVQWPLLAAIAVLSAADNAYFSTTTTYQANGVSAQTPVSTIVPASST